MRDESDKNDKSGEDAARQIQDLHKVLDITRELVATEDLDALLNLIVERGMELLTAERATVFLYDRDSDELVSRVAAGTEEIRIDAGTGIAGAAAKSGKIVNVPDAYADNRFHPEVDRQTGFRTRNILSIPMHGYDGALVGVLQVLNRPDPNAVSAGDDYEITLAETLAAQAGVAIQRAELIAHYLRKQEMERAMQIARDIQQALLPKSNPSIDGFQVAGFSQPADETGGDMYDFMPLGDGRWMFLIADATGHGIGPALVVAETRAMLRAVALEGASISDVLHTTNKLLSGDLTGGRFVTCFFAVLNPSDCTLSYASAGHGPILFYDRDGDSFEEVPATSIPLGIMEETNYSDTIIQKFKPGDFAAILTDGFFEAANDKDEMFGTERVKDIFRQYRDLPPDEMIDKVRLAAGEFTGDCPQADDLTAVIIRKN